jgi:ubiquitin-like 1-activating enzyme E1 B
MVGAGGIGCELLKTLVLSGFTNIEMIDLDTIDVSNLNRQFLFRRKHVGQSKARVAKESALKFRGKDSGIAITAHHGNVKDDAFSTAFIKGFDVVLNGLDNLEARKHVNRLCLAAEVPLVESGTAGYLGQVTVHERGKTACFECSPKPTPKSHPICTLRDTPEKPVHCVVYAAELLLPRLFSSRRHETSDLDEEDAVELGVFSRDVQNDESYASFAVRVFNFVFREKIEALLRKEEMWESRPRPKPLPSFAELIGANESPESVAVGNDESGLIRMTASEAVGGVDVQEVMSVERAARVFVSSVARVLTRDETGANGADGAGGGDPLSRRGTDAFDKDDALAVDFVSAVATLRSANYGIAPQSPFDIKGVAGNIVHAVATTNAIVGGLIALEAIKILRRKDATGGDGNTAPLNFPAPAPCPQRYTFVKQRATNNRALEPVEPDPPSKGCAACGRARLELVCDTESFTLGRLIDEALVKKLGMTAPEVNAPGTVLFEQPVDLEEDERAQYEKNSRTVLAKLPAGGVRHGAVLSVSDFTQKFEFELSVTHRPKDDWDDEEDPEGFVLRGDRNAIGEDEDDTNGHPDAREKDSKNVDDADDGFEIVDEEGSRDAEIVVGPDGVSAKRERDDDETDRGEASLKKLKGRE